MSKNIAIIYSTVDGQTKRICEHLVNVFQKSNIKVELFSIEDFNQDIECYQTLIIGASIRYGKHNKLIHEFVETNKNLLAKIKTAFFSVNLVARKPEKNSVDTNPYFIKFLEETKWKPNFTEVFAGVLNYDVYPLFDKIMIKFIMLITKGPTSSDKPIEYTNWNKIDAFAETIVDNYQS